MLMTREFINSLAFVSNFCAPDKTIHDELKNIKLCVTPEAITITALEGSYMAHRVLTDIGTEETFSVMLRPECFRRIINERPNGELIYDGKKEEISLIYDETIYNFSNRCTYFPDTDAIIKNTLNRKCKLTAKNGVCVLSENFELLHKAIKAYNKNFTKENKDSTYKMFFGDSDSPIRIIYRDFLIIVMPVKWAYTDEIE